MHSPFQSVHLLGRAARRAFTITEVLIATTIAGLAATGMVVVLIFGLKVNQGSANTISHSTYVRNLTQELFQDIRAANRARVYSSVAATNVNSEVAENAQGDYLLLFFRSWDPVAREDRIEWVVGYYLITQKVKRRDELVDVRRIYRFRNDSPSATDLKNIDLATFTGFGAAPHRLLADDVTYSDGDTGIFENLKNGGVRVQARFALPSNAEGERSRFTLYNFTASPRG